MKQAQRGFTLIELMIAVVVIGILSAIAIPNYRNYVQKAERGAAKAVMLNLMQTEERYFTNNGTYLAIAALPTAAPAGWQNYSGSSTTSVKYDITVAAGLISGAGTTAITDNYTITATPVTMDGVCNILRLDSSGAKAISSPPGAPAPTGTIAQCW
jgi:type IV pilus assembly protein PilE